MTEGAPQTLEQARQLNQSLTEKVLDKATNDPQWRQQLIEDPEAAMRGANFPETQQLPQKPPEDEVRGQAYGENYYWYCSWWTYYWDKYYY